MSTAMRPVFLADTCVCGLSVLKSLWMSGSAAEAVFMADYAVNPLGVRSDSEIAGVAGRWIQLAGQHSDTLVIACNTLSIRYHQLQRAGTPLPGLRRILTMVDCLRALVQTEALRLDGRRVLIIGTEYTASQSVYPEVFAEALPATRVRTIGATGLERAIARFQIDENGMDDLIGPALAAALGETDAAVLACTCFPLVKAELESRFPDVLFLDPGEYCAGLLAQDGQDGRRKLSLKVTGGVVPAQRITEFAKSYLGSDSVALL